MQVKNMKDDVYDSLSSPLKKLYKAHQNENKLQEHMSLRHMEGILYAAKQQGYKGTGKSRELEDFTKNRFKDNPDALQQYKKDIALHHAARGYQTFADDHGSDISFEEALKKVQKLYESDAPGQRQRFNTYMREHTLMDETRLTQHIEQYGENFVPLFAQRELPQYANAFAQQEVAAYKADIKSEHLPELEKVTGLKKNFSDVISTEGLSRDDYLNALGELATKGTISDDWVRTNLLPLYTGKKEKKSDDKKK